MQVVQTWQHYTGKHSNPHLNVQGLDRHHWLSGQQKMRWRIFEILFGVGTQVVGKARRMGFMSRFRPKPRARNPDMDLGADFGIAAATAAENSHHDVIMGDPDDSMPSCARR